jgi:hypothetical protein
MRTLILTAIAGLALARSRQARKLELAYKRAHTRLRRDGGEPSAPAATFA